MYDGTIVGWDPGGHFDASPLFHVKHDDGHDEDLEEHEATAAIAVFSFQGDDWQADHLWVGKRVRRTTAGTTTDGTIVAWDPTGFKDEPPEPLFHAVHDDGDEEDLEEHEAQAAILAAATAQAEAYAKAEGLTLEPAKNIDNKSGYNGRCERRVVASSRSGRAGSASARTTRPRRRRSHARVISQSKRHGCTAAADGGGGGGEGEAVADAKAEGLTLEPARTATTRYNGVRRRRTVASRRSSGSTACTARRRRRRSHARALAAAGAPPPLPPPKKNLSAEAAKAVDAAAAEGLTLERSERSSRGTTA